MSEMDRADALAKSMGYIGIWSMPRERREEIIERANRAFRETLQAELSKAKPSQGDGNE